MKGKKGSSVGELPFAKATIATYLKIDSSQSKASRNPKQQDDWGSVIRL